MVLVEKQIDPGSILFILNFTLRSLDEVMSNLHSKAVPGCDCFEYFKLAFFYNIHNLFIKQKFIVQTSARIVFVHVPKIGFSFNFARILAQN